MGIKGDTGSLDSGSHDVVPTLNTAQPSRYIKFQVPMKLAQYFNKKVAPKR